MLVQTLRSSQLKLGNCDFKYAVLICRLKPGTIFKATVGIFVSYMSAWFLSIAIDYLCKP